MILLVCNKTGDLIGVLRVETRRLRASYITRPLRAIVFLSYVSDEAGHDDTRPLGILK